jgi:hypothetical protein
MNEPITSGLLAPHVLVYLGMGLMSARMLLDNQKLRGFSWLQYLQFFVHASSIVLLWPLVLFTDKFEHWVKSPAEGNANDDTQHNPAP